MRFSAARARLPSLTNTLLAVVSAILLTLAFPNFDWWFLAWFALAPLLCAVEREQSVIKSFVLGWIFGVCFFFGTCWWLTFAPVTYGGVPAFVAYFLLFGATLVVGIFSALFAALFSVILRSFGTYAILAAPFLWTATEFLRFNLTGNNWNALGYSQAFRPQLIQTANLGGIYLISFLILLFNAFIAFNMVNLMRAPAQKQKSRIVSAVVFVLISLIFSVYELLNSNEISASTTETKVIAIQPNVPMRGLKYGEWEKLRARHVELAENALQKIRRENSDNLLQNIQIIFPESPMNFQYESDREFQKFIKDFATRNNVSVLFNSAQPNRRGTNFFNSAVLINPQGEKIGQYDKIHLVPFGETVPLPDALAAFVPTMVGNFEIGADYNLLPFGAARGGVMICFESHFASLAREFVRGGADVLIEMTNDGYLGDTPVLRQHLANAIFRAVETNRPVLRVTNVGITAYINERGEVSDASKPYTEDTRVWTISKANGSQTFYVRYGDWFAWLCSIVSLALLFWSFRGKTDRSET